MFTVLLMADMYSLALDVEREITTIVAGGAERPSLGVEELYPYQLLVSHTLLGHKLNLHK
jgi:hypothetical protein